MIRPGTEAEYRERQTRRLLWPVQDDQAGGLRRPAPMQFGWFGLWRLIRWLLGKTRD